MRLTLPIALFLIACQSVSAVNLHQRQILESFISDIFGGDDNDPTTTSRPPRSTPRPSTTGRRSSSSVTPTTSRSPKATPARTSSESSTTETSTTPTTSSDTTTITSSATLTSTETATKSSTTTTSATNPADAKPTSKPSSSQSSISPAGIAVAVIFSILIALLLAWVIFRYHPKSRAWWARRQEEKYKERSYRDALDGPDATVNKSGLSRTKTTLSSFFTPRSARLGSGREIKRKTINWGAPMPHVESGHARDNDLHMPDRSYGPGIHSQYGRSEVEKVPLATMASPMGLDSRRQYNMDSMSATANSPLSPVSPMGSGSAQRSISGLSAATSNASTRPNARHSKPLPQVMVNGKEVYELE